MYAVPTDLDALLRGSHQARARLLALTDTGEVRRTWQDGTAALVSASVNFDRARAARRTGTAEIANRDGSLTPTAPGDLFHPGSRFRLERGGILDGLTVYVPMATLVVTRFGATMRGRLSITGEDPLWLCQQPMGEQMTLAPDMTAEAALRALLEPVLGDGDDWALDGAGRVLGTARTLFEDDDRLASAVSIMRGLGLEVFSDRLGAPVLRPTPDPTTATPVRTWTAAPRDAVFLDLSRTGDRLPMNRVVVIGEGPDRPTVRAVAEVTDPSSPLHRDRIGLRQAPVWRSEQVPDQAAANAVASALLVEQALIQDAISGDIVPDPLLDEDDVVEVTETISGTADRYRIDQVTHPVTPGALSVVATRVVPIFLEPTA
jgi:hypothetical protein